MGRKRRKNNHQLPSSLSNKEKLKFSFEYYDRSSNNYCLSYWNQSQIRKTLLKLQDVCTKSFNELRKERRVYHFNEVIWEKTIEKGGFPNHELNKLSAFHFALIGVNGQLARIYGAYSAGTFFIVWFDLNHKIWPTKLKHT